MLQKFDVWNVVKKATNSKTIRLNVKPREIYWVKIGQNIGDEEYGKGKDFTRPVIVLRKLTSDLFVGIPTTTANKDNDYFYSFFYNNRKSGTIRVSAMILQLRVFSIKRVTNKVGVIKKEDFKNVIHKAQKLIAPT